MCDCACTCTWYTLMWGLPLTSINETSFVLPNVVQQPELISPQALSCEILSPHLAKVLSRDTIIIAAWQFVDKSQHLIFGSDELWLSGTAKGKKVRGRTNWNTRKGIFMCRGKIKSHLPKQYKFLSSSSPKLWSLKLLVNATFFFQISDFYFNWKAVPFLKHK